MPPTPFEAFWRVVEGLLAPGGRVFFIDEGEPGAWSEDWIDRASGVTRRRLRDGSIHRAVKVLWRPADLERRLRVLGWDTSVHAHAPFYWGTAARGTG